MGALDTFFNSSFFLFFFLFFFLSFFLFFFLSFFFSLSLSLSLTTCHYQKFGCCMHTALFMQTISNPPKRDCTLWKKNDLHKIIWMFQIRDSIVDFIHLFHNNLCSQLVQDEKIIIKHTKNAKPNGFLSLQLFQFCVQARKKGDRTKFLFQRLNPCSLVIQMRKNDSSLAVLDKRCWFGISILCSLKLIAVMIMIVVFVRHSKRAQSTNCDLSLF